MTVWIRRVRLEFSLAACLGLLACGGCGDGVVVPPLGKVTGTVKLNGEPLPNAVILFQPVGKAGGPSQGTTDSSGVYTLSHLPNHPGAVLGEHVVRITAKSGAAADAEPVPPKYNDKSELKVTVEAGENTHDFDLLSK